MYSSGGEGLFLLAIIITGYGLLLGISIEKHQYANTIALAVLPLVILLFVIVSKLRNKNRRRRKGAIKY